MKHRIILSIIVFTGTSLLAQDPHFTQFYANPLYMNPALIGTGFRDKVSAGRVTTNYRNHFSGLPGNFRTMSLGYDQAFDALHGGLGAQLVSDVKASGLVTTNEINIQYAYSGKNKMQTLQYRIGARLGYTKKSLDLDALRYKDQLTTFDSINFTPNGNPEENIYYPNLGLGMHFCGSQWNLGIQIANITQPNISFYHNPHDVLPRRVTIHGGYSFSLSNNLFITPQVQYQKQDNSSEIMLGVNANQNNLIYGLWYRQTFGQYRNLDAIAGTIGYNFKGFRLIYSYDVAISDGRSAIPSSHELSLRYCWKTKQTKPKFCNALN